MSKINIIGAGFSSLSAACYLARDGHQVTVFERNASIGGRARQFCRDGFTFDMGPTWYWMPDVFERFFADFGKHPSDYYSLFKLSPAYKVYFGKGDSVVIGDNLPDILRTFESIEKGSAVKLERFLKQARKNYEIAIENLVYRPGMSPLELITPQTISNMGQFFGSVSQEVRKVFNDPRLVQILEFPVLFLGAKPSDTPPFYTFMNHADFGLGTWYPDGGMYSVVDGMSRLAAELGVEIRTNATVDKIITDNNKVRGLRVDGTDYLSEIVISGADYHHTESLLQPEERNYSEKYWSKKTFAPSSLLFYVGFDRKIENVAHHTMFFDSDFAVHAEAIYDKPHWPDNPLFYASFPSKTDFNAAPEGKEAAIFLIPLAPGLEDNEEIRTRYFRKIINRLQQITEQNLDSHVMFCESFGISDFVESYNSYRGNAYGLANTLLQTAFLRPSLKSRKVANLYFTGQLTVPGPGVPPSLISGKLVSELIKNNISHESIV